MAFKKSLYQILEIRSDATAEALKEAYEARLARLADAVSAEDLSTRSMLRDAFEILGDPLRRKQYDERLREELIRALSSGMDEERPRGARQRALELGCTALRSRACATQLACDVRHHPL